MDYSEIIDKAYALVDAVKKSEEFKLLKQLKSEIDLSLGDLIEKFNQAKEKYTDALKYGKYHPDLEKYKQELSEIKQELFTNELVEKYKKLEVLIQEKFDIITNEVKRVMSNKFEQTKKIDL